MRVALISYECPPDTALGGIATYVRLAAGVLRARGHDVEVFAGSTDREGAFEEDGIRVHRVAVPERWMFSRRIAPVFAERHASVRFDVLEGTDYHADARDAVRLVPDIPLVVKVHSPHFLLERINRPHLPLARRARLYARAARRVLRPASDYERLHALDADEVAVPTRAIGEIVTRTWRLPPERVAYVPIPFAPAPELLGAPAGPRGKTVGFVGRMDAWKGVIDLARAIPEVLRRHPDATFRFVGKPGLAPRGGGDMQRYLSGLLSAHRDAVEFRGGVPPSAVPSVLAGLDVCVFPSHWENAGIVCLEAMAAARPIVASQAGGMAEALDGGRVGRLVPPRRPGAIARAVAELLEDPDVGLRLGLAARERVLREFDPDRVGALQEESYARAIGRRRRSGARRAAPVPARAAS